MASADDCLRGSRVTGDHDAAVCRIKTIAIRKIPCAMRHGKSAHGNVRVFVNDSRMNLMRVDVICIRVSVFQAVDANVHVFYISRLNVARHRGDAGRAIEFQRSGTAFYGRSEIKIGQASSVVRMQVRGKDDFQIFWRERDDVLVAGGSSGASHHARTKVDKISGAVHHHGNRRAGTVRIDDGRARAENDELGVELGRASLTRRE